MSTMLSKTPGVSDLSGPALSAAHPDAKNWSHIL